MTGRWGGGRRVSLPPGPTPGGQGLEGPQVVHMGISWRLPMILGVGLGPGGRIYHQHDDIKLRNPFKQ